MTLTTKTPAEIDTEMVEVQSQEDRKIETARGAVGRAKEARRLSLEILEAGTDRVDGWWAKNRDRHRLDLEVAEAALVQVIADHDAALAPFFAEWDARGGWSRYYIVANVNGHVHRGFGCATCFPTTHYSWLTSLSGLTEEEMVAVMGETACTVCYPDAPAFQGFEDGTSYVAKASAAEKAAKADAKAVKAEAKAKKAITNVDGSTLRVGGNTYRTLRSAEIGITQAIMNAFYYDRTRETHLNVAVALAYAVAAKTNRTRAEVIAAHLKKANTNLRKEGHGPIESLDSMM